MFFLSFFMMLPLSYGMEPVLLRNKIIISVVIGTKIDTDKNGAFFQRLIQLIPVLSSFLKPGLHMAYGHWLHGSV